MNRRTVLSLLAGVGLGGTVGCLTNDSVAAPSSSPSPSATADVVDASTPAEGECDAAPVPKPDTTDTAGLPAPKVYPGKPGTFDADTVRSFLESYEAVYTFNSMLADVAASGQCLKYREIYAAGSELDARGEGFIAEITVRGSSTGAVCPEAKGTGTDSPTPPPHADFPPMTARYVVTERFLIRDGVVVACWT